MVDFVLETRFYFLALSVRYSLIYLGYRITFVLEVLRLC